MSQITKGIFSIFSNPEIYDGFQNLMGAVEIRKELVREYIRPVPGAKILDIGCGTAEILGFLPQDVCYWGFDISSRYIESARKRFGARGHFHCGLFDSEKAALLPKFDIVMAFGVLHHLDDDEAVNIFALASSVITDSGRVISMDPCFVVGQNPIARFLISKDRGQNVRDQSGYCNLPSNIFLKIDGKVRHRSRVPYTDWVMQCSGVRGGVHVVSQSTNWIVALNS